MTNILAICFNGYSKFYDRFEQSVKAQTVKPENLYLVLGRNHGFRRKPEYPTIIKSKKRTLGGLVNDGLKQIKGRTLYFSVDDILLGNAIEQVESVDADIVSLKYFSPKGVRKTPEIKKERIKDWEKYYIGASGYFTVNGGERVDESDFWKYEYLFRNHDKTIKSTEDPCAVYLKRNDGHGSGRNFKKGRQAISKFAEIYG